MSVPPSPPSPPPSPSGSDAEEVAVAVVAAAATGAVAAKQAGGVKDTLESVLIALILAFLFRAFFVEAFVIPTGSMATTLYGAHMRFTCEDCGYGFTANYQAPQIPGSDDIVIPSQAEVVANARGSDGRLQPTRFPAVFSLSCPNCGYRVPRTLPSQPDNDATAPSVHYGDRILVMKYAYLLHSPARWDVVVFKSPFDQRAADPSPRRLGAPEFQQNYIKRLVGLPGEQVMILDGDVYTRSPRDEQGFSPEGWQVQPKPRHVQEALWRLVQNNDFQPRQLARAPEPAYRSPWTESTGTPAFTAENLGREFTSSGDAVTEMRFDPDANPRKFALTDWLVFNSTAGQQVPGRDPDQYNFRELTPDNTVSDLQLRLTWQRLNSEGKLVLSMSKRQDRFRVELTATTATLIRSSEGTPDVVLATAPLPSGTTLDLVLENVDYRVALRMNGKEILATTPAQYSPDIAGLYRDLLAGVRQPRSDIVIRTENHAARLSHLSLWRDIFYSNRTNQIGHKVPLWGNPDQPITLSPSGNGNGEYFVLGDNSQLSLDARFWDDPIRLPWEQLDVADGRVPDRFMLGKAFYVYWPAGYRPSAGMPGVIPNFEKMRLIH